MASSADAGASMIHDNTPQLADPSEPIAGYWTPVSLKICPPEVTQAGFQSAIKIWCNKPHVANRKLSGSEPLWTSSIIRCKHWNFDEFVSGFIGSVFQGIDEIFRHQQWQDKGSFVELVKQKLTQCCDQLTALGQNDDLGLGEHSSGVELIVCLRCLISKSLNKFGQTLEIVILHHGESFEAVFMPVVNILNNLFSRCFDTSTQTASLLTEFIYKIGLSQHINIATGVEEHRISLSVHGPMTDETTMVGGCSCSITWLKDVLLKKLSRWSEETSLNTEITSLTLIPIQRYTETYLRLKEKYGRHLVEIWTEKTDPQKFVFEDIGIASYLIVLWEEENKASSSEKKQSFVDLGCGNGLLVYLLTMEGYSGIGVDVRRRKIWDVLSCSDNLKECAITPSDATLFPEYDWLIGNHSDELTPWIPVIAARSHHKCRYFVLPCCAWDFDARFSAKTPCVATSATFGEDSIITSSGGNKTRVSSTSQYQCYLNFVEEVGRQCGFIVQRDILRIPSTKRTCFIGASRTYSTADETVIDRSRTSYIMSRCKSTSKQSNELALSSGSSSNYVHENSTQSHAPKNNSAMWTEGFKVRSSVETSRNTTCLSRTVKDHVTITTYNKLLKSQSCIVQLPGGRSWNRGGFIPLSVLSSLFDRDVLMEMKSECGGLQTLLKNCPDVFIIRDGQVGLRDWTSADYAGYQRNRQKKRRITDAAVAERVKTKECFHFLHHPDSCPLPINSCRFAHGLDDIRTDAVTVM